MALLTEICLAGLAATLAALALMGAAKTLSPVVEWMRCHRVDALLLAPFILCLVYTGATKSTRGTVTFPYTDIEMRYLTDAGSYVTNDLVHVAYTRWLVPDSATLYGAVRPCGSTNDEEWVIFLTTTFAAFTSPTNVPYAGALTNNFQFFTTWTPGPAVHTNGVAVIEWQRPIRESINEIVPRRTGFYVDGERLAPNPGITNGPPVSLTVTLTE